MPHGYSSTAKRQTPPSRTNDCNHYLHRYTRADFACLAKQAGLQLCDARHFMILLSPRYWLRYPWGTSVLGVFRK